MTIGRYPAITLKMARDASLEHTRAIATGTDPRDARLAARAEAELDRVALSTLLDEAQAKFTPTRVVWRENGCPGRTKPEARASIENVFADLLVRAVGTITVADIKRCTRTYAALRPRSGKPTANGPVSRAMNHLRTVSNWAAGRAPCKKTGDRREPTIGFPDIGEIHDPSAGDPSIAGKRERVLDQDEIAAILPLLTYPAPAGLRERLDPK